MTRQPALLVERLSVTYSGGFRALDNVTLSLPAGQRLGVVGASGCGKTTLVRTILGLLPPRTRVTGRVRVDGQDVLGLRGRELRALRGDAVGYVAQDPFAACDPLRSIRHHVAEAWTAKGRRPSEGVIEQGLASVGIPQASTRMRQHPHQWSGGMLQRATTLAAGVHHPVLTLADEPTSALDRELGDDMLDLLWSNCSSLLLVSHDLALVGRHADEVAVLEGGRVVEHGSADRVLRSADHPVTKRLLTASSPAPYDGSPPPKTSTPVLRLRGVSRAYTVGNTQVDAVRAVDLDAFAGEVIGLVGPSGSGKSTLLRLAAGMERPDTGTVSMGGVDPWASGGSRARWPRPGWVMPVFQDPVASLDPRWPIWRTVAEPLVAQGARDSRQALRARVRQELSSMGLADIDIDRRPGALSVGQCQRVALARSVIGGPGVIVADEPTASLDVDSAALAAGALRAAAGAGAAVLVASHDELRLASIANRIMRLDPVQGLAPTQ